MSDNLNFFALEPRIMFDGAMAGDVVDQTTETTDQPDHTPEPASSDKKQVVLISNAVADNEDLANAVKDGVIAITYDADASLDSILDSLKAALGDAQADSIALASHNGLLDGSFYINDTLVTLNRLTADEAVQNFFKEIGTLIKPDGRLDILACDFAGSEQGTKAHSLITDLVGRTVTASEDETGNEASGGDWFMELGEIDASSYFDQDRLQDFDGTLILDTPTLADFLVQDGRVENMNIDNVVNFYDGTGLAFSATVQGDDGPQTAIVLTNGDGFLEIYTHPDWTAETTIQELYVEPLIDRQIFQVRIISQTGDVAQFAYLDTVGDNSTIQAVDLSIPDTGELPSHIRTLASEGEQVSLLVNYPPSNESLMAVINLEIGEVERFPNSFIGDEIVETAGSNGVGNLPYKVANSNDGIVIMPHGGEVIFAGQGARLVHTLVATETKVFFWNGLDELWVTDGTEEGTRGAAYFSVDAEDPAVEMHAFGDKVVFTATNNIWISDGRGAISLTSVSDTTVLQSLNVKVFGDYLYYSGVRTEADEYGGLTVYDLWRTDGTRNGTTLVKTLNSGEPFDLSKSVIYQEELYFVADNDGHGNELFVSDGTAEGTRVFMDIPGYYEGFTGQLMVVNDQIFAEVKTTADSPSAFYRLDMIVNSAPTVDVNVRPVLTIDPLGTGQEGSVQTAVAPNGVLQDLDGDTEWNGGTLVLEVVSGTQWENFELTGSYDATYSIDPTGQVFRNGLQIGTAVKTASSIDAGASISFTFNEYATNEIVQSVLQHVNYALNVEAGLSGERTVRITATDKDGGTTTFDRTLLINERPLITVVAPPPPVYSVGGDPVVFSNISAIADTSNVTLKFQITGNAQATDILTFTRASNFYIEGSYLYRDGSNIAHVNRSTGIVTSDSELVFTFNQNATSEDMVNVSKAITFSSSAAAPTADDRTITTTAVDYFGAETSVTNVVTINEAPKVDTTQTNPVIYTPGGNPVKLADITGITEDKIDGATLSFQITGNAEAGDVLAFDLEGTGLSFQDGNIVIAGFTLATLNVTTQSVTGASILTVTFTEGATADTVKWIWNSLTYSSQAEETGLNDRRLTATIVDSEGATTVLTRTIDINEAPKVVSTDTTFPLYHAGGTAVDLVNNLTITEDAVDGAKLKFFVAGNAESTDVLAFSAATPYRLDGTNLYIASTLIATVNVTDAKVTSNSELVFTFNERARISDIQNVWKSIEFSSTATEPGTGLRQIKATVVDGFGAEATKTHFMKVNLPPKIEAVTETGHTVTLGDGPLALDQTITLSDGDGWYNASIRFQVSEETADFTTLKLDLSSVPNLVIENGSIYVSGVMIATINSDDGVAAEGAELVINFTQNITDEVAQAIYRSVVFSYGGQDVPAAAHDIAVRVTDNAGHITDLAYTVTVVEPIPVSSSTETVKTVVANEGDVNPVSIVQDPVNLGQQDSAAPQTFVNPNAQGTSLGTDGARTFLAGNSGLSLGTDGQRTVIRSDNAASGTGQSAGAAGWGGFSSAGNGAGGGLGGQAGGLGDASFSDDGAPGEGPLGEDLLDGMSQQAPAGDQQAALEEATPARDSFMKQLAKRGRNGAFGTAELLTAANDQLLKVKGA